jgi:hypothetical protein
LRWWPRPIITPSVGFVGGSFHTNCGKVLVRLQDGFESSRLAKLPEHYVVVLRQFVRASPLRWTGDAPPQRLGVDCAANACGVYSEFPGGDMDGGAMPQLVRAS